MPGWKSLSRDERALEISEYAVILALIGAGTVAALASFASSIAGTLRRVVDVLAP